MRNENASLVRFNKIKRLIDTERFTPLDFLSVCPYTLEELSKRSKKNELLRWRQVGIVWFKLSNKSLRQSAMLFGRDHATGIHAAQIVLNALEGSLYPEITEIINLICQKSREVTYNQIPIEAVVDFLNFYYTDQKLVQDIAQKVTPLMNVYSGR